MADKLNADAQESLDRFRQAHRKGMEALHSSDSDRLNLLDVAIADERRAIDEYWEEIAFEREAFERRIAALRDRSLASGNKL